MGCSASICRTAKMDPEYTPCRDSPKKKTTLSPDMIARNLEEVHFKQSHFITVRNENIYDTYRIVKKIGKGAYSSVSLAVHRKTRAQRAVKTIKKNRLADERAQRA